MVCDMSLRVSGFTLLEILVVLTLISIIVTFALLSSGDVSAQHALREAKRLDALLRLAQQEAQLNNALLGWEQTVAGYRFTHFHDQKWEAYPQSSPFRERSLALPVRLSVSNCTISWPKPDNLPMPEIIFSADGEVTPCAIAIVVHPIGPPTAIIEVADNAEIHYVTGQ